MTTLPGADDRELLKSAPLSVLHTIAGYYIKDADDYLQRFNRLWEAMLHKTGRIKSFVDLLLACECALKAHIVLSRVREDPGSVYVNVRRYRHDLERLAADAKFLENAAIYAEIRERLGPFSVFIRYSLDAYEVFFPSALERDQALINHSKTIGSNDWVLECRDLVAALLPEPQKALSGIVTADLNALMEHDKEMQAFADKFIRR